jgi:hypothetical protein
MSAKKKTSKSGDQWYMIVGYWQDQQQSYVGDFQAKDPIGALRACKQDICGGSSGEFPELIAIFESEKQNKDRMIFPSELDSERMIELDLWDEFGIRCKACGALADRSEAEDRIVCRSAACSEA